MRGIKGVILITLTFFLLALTRVDSSEVVTKEVSYKIGNNDKIKDIACYQDEPGTLKTVGTDLFFKSLKKKVRTLRKKKNSNSKFVKRFKNTKKLFKAARTACSNSFQVSPTPTPTPPPGSTSTPTPTPTPEPSSEGDGFYDNDGNVTTAGKKAFGIPSELSADLITGSQTWQSYCTGCHEERRRTTFSELRLAISQDPMFYTEDLLPDSDLANIMAYLGRFRTP